MNIGAIDGYSPISYVSPYETTSAVAAASNLNVSQTGNDKNAENVKGTERIANKKVDKTDPSYKCETCANRKYQDGSNENNVSFKSASHIAPEAVASAVRNHEQMHVTNAFQKAEQDNGKVISSSVQIHTSICPECGKTYVSGGTTRTQIKYANEDNPYQKKLKEFQGGLLRGLNFDREV